MPHCWRPRDSTEPSTASASRSAAGDLAAIYVPGGGVVTLRGELLTDQLKPLWFSPQVGGMRNARALRERIYRTPTASFGGWVSCVDAPLALNGVFAADAGPGYRPPSIRLPPIFACPPFACLLLTGAHESRA